MFLGSFRLFRINSDKQAKLKLLSLCLSLSLSHTYIHIYIYIYWGCYVFSVSTDVIMKSGLLLVLDGSQIPELGERHELLYVAVSRYLYPETIPKP